MQRHNTGGGLAFSWALGAIAIVASPSVFVSPARAAEIWRAGSVLTITENVEVRDSLVIEAGVTVSFGEFAGIDILAGATLTIEGTAESPVRLLPIDPELAWLGLTFLPGSHGELRHMDLSGANSTSIAIFESSPLIEFCRIGNTAASQFSGSPLRSGIRISGAGAAPIIRRSIIESIRGGSSGQANSGANGFNGTNGANGSIFGDEDGGPGVTGTDGANGVNAVALAGSATGIWVVDGAGATIESNVIRWMRGGDGTAGGNGGKGGNGGDGGNGYSGGITPGVGGGGAEGSKGGNGGNGNAGGGAHGIFVDKAGGEVIIAGNAIYAIAGGRGGNGGNGGAGGDGGDGGDGGSCSFCSSPGDGADGGGGGAGGAGGAAGPSGATRAITIQLPLAPSTVQVVNNSVALILAPEPALGGLGGAGGAPGVGGLGGEAQFGGGEGLDGSNGAPGTSGMTAGVGSVLLAYGVSAAGAGLTVETRNHASDVDPAGIAPSGSAAFRAEVSAQMSVSHSVFAGHSVIAVGAVTLGPSSLEADPQFVAPPTSIPVASDCCTWTGSQIGCSNLACEGVVCTEDPTCCSGAWDAGCADLAWSLCPSLCQPLASTNLAVAATSPAIDLGTNDAVPEMLATDLAFGPRITDGDGNGSAVVDAGAYESPAVDCGVDLTCDGVVDGADLATMLGAWGTCPAPCAADLDGSGAVDGADLAILLGGWGFGG